MMLSASPIRGNEIEFTVRTRTTNEADGTTVHEESVNWDGRKTAAIVCDMWDSHWCRGASRRVAELGPHMNTLLANLRKKGVLIIHAPSSCMNAYAEHPARARAQDALRAVPRSPKQRSSAPLLAEQDVPWPIDQSDGGCDCTPTCEMGRPWTRQCSDIKVDDRDAISDSQPEILALLSTRSITNVLFMGVHVNMCVVGRPFGLRALIRAGLNAVLVRDMTDSMYNSRMRPFVGHHEGTERVIEHIEGRICPTALSGDLSTEGSFTFGDWQGRQVVFVVGEREYRTRQTLPRFAREHLEPLGIRCVFVHAASDGDDDAKHEFPGLAVALGNADLVFISARRRALRPDQMRALHRHLDGMKPLIGIRTASHAFHTRGKHPEGYVQWEGFDADVFGGNYHGHHAAGPKAWISPVEGHAKHAILEGVHAFASVGSLYEVRPLNADTTILLTGTIPGKDSEPVAWTRRYKGNGKVFCTSLGHWDDFGDPSFVRLLTNAVKWALRK